MTPRTQRKARSLPLVARGQGRRRATPPRGADKEEYRPSVAWRSPCSCALMHGITEPALREKALPLANIRRAAAIATHAPPGASSASQEFGRQCATSRVRALADCLPGRARVGARGGASGEVLALDTVKREASFRSLTRSGADLATGAIRSAQSHTEPRARLAPSVCPVRRTSSRATGLLRDSDARDLCRRRAAAVVQEASALVRVGHLSDVLPCVSQLAKKRPSPPASPRVRLRVAGEILSAPPSDNLLHSPACAAARSRRLISELSATVPFPGSVDAPRINGSRVDLISFSDFGLARDGSVHRAGSRKGSPAMRAFCMIRR
jgi:hypothetical protein